MMAGHSALNRQLHVAFLGGYLHQEWHQQHAPPHGIVDVIEPRLVVADDPELELRGEVEEIAAHEAGGHLVTAGHGLDPRLVPAAALLGFLRDHQAIAVQLGDVGGVAFSAGRATVA
jgi:hypothetical protein